MLHVLIHHSNHLLSYCHAKTEIYETVNRKEVLIVHNKRYLVYFYNAGGGGGVVIGADEAKRKLSSCTSPANSQFAMPCFHTYVRRVNCPTCAI